jgi:transcription antitermination factor NusG
MACNAIGYQSASESSSLHEIENLAIGEFKWYALYTCPRHEKVVQQQLNTKAIESYLPLYRSLRRWKDRKATLELPLFPGYLFVRIPISARLRVLTVAGVVRIISFNGQLACLSDQEIQALKTSIALRAAEPYPYLVEGKRVRITTGPLSGLCGVVIRRKGKLRVVVSIHSIMQSFAVELDAADAELVPNSSRLPR